MGVLDNPAFAQRVIQSTSAVALTALVYDNLLTLDDEIRFIWSQKKSSPVKWLYLFTRYWALTTVVSSYVPSAYIKAHAPVPPSGCLAIYLTALLTSGFSTVAVEVILVTRVYYLYHQTRFVGLFLIALIVATTTTSAVLSYKTTSLLHFDEICLSPIPTSALIHFSIPPLVLSVLLAILTSAKYIAASRAGWGNMPLITVLMRDGMVAFGTVILVWIILLMVSIFMPQIPSIFVFYIQMALLPPLGCRVIINIQTLKSEALPGSVELTSIHCEQIVGPPTETQMLSTYG